MHRLPARIAAVMVGTLLVFALTVGASVLWLTRALDDQAHMQSLAQIRNAQANLLAQTRLITLDYAKWDDAVAAVAARDMEWLRDNMGSSAVLGEAAQLLLLWGGPLGQDIGWTDDGHQAGRTGLVDPAVLGLAESRLTQVPLGSYEGTEFFAWSGGDLFVLGAARVEGMSDGPGAAVDADIGRLAMGHRVTPDVVHGIAEDYLLRDLRLVRVEPKDRLSVPLLDAMGQPVAWLAWAAPQPGATMLNRLMPPLLVVLALVTGLAALGIALVRRSAHRLVVAEHTASVAARTDALTGLPNRMALSEALDLPERGGQRAILFLDVNGFKRINDSIGHAAGDAVILDLAERLATLNPDGSLLARIGGDEFVFLLLGPQAGALAERVAQDVEWTLRTPFHVPGHLLRLQVAMGHAVQADDSLRGEDLLRQADLAMFQAKRLREPGSVAYSALIEQAAYDASAIEGALRNALKRGGELSIAYQPIARPGGGLVRAEALARWTSPELGPIPPDRFIAVAEQSGLIIRLGRELLRLICDDLAAHPDLQVSLNVSPLQLMSPTFVGDLLAELASRNLDPARIEVELTESMVVDDPRLAAQRLKELSEAGFATALDDFGTGYSSIGYLQQMGFDTLKVDRSFVTGFCEEPGRVALVNAMILLAHALGLRVTCEGVETVEELEMLGELGCDLAQGYHLDRPLPIGALSSRWLGGEMVRTVAA